METKIILLVLISLNTLANSALIRKADSKCKTSGNSCIDCWTSLYCVEEGNDMWYEEIINCATGQACQTTTGECQLMGNYECFPPTPDPPTNPPQEPLFVCHGPGIYPSPFNCKQYYICIFDSATSKYMVNEASCGDKYVFDAFTNRCTKKLENGASCDSKIPICVNAGQTGNLTSNPNLFYRCLQKDGPPPRLIPEIFPCPNNYFHNGERCVDPTPDVVDANGMCKAKGLFYLPGVCEKYRECTAAGVKPVEKTCQSPTTQFDPTVSKCVRYECSKRYINV